MKYLQIQRDEYKPFITIGEYLYDTDPFVFEQLCMKFIHKDVYTVWKEVQKVLSGVIHAAENLVNGIDKQQVRECLRKIIECLMKEPPKPGRGGLLPDETEEDLYYDGGADYEENYYFKRLF